MTSQELELGFKDYCHHKKLEFIMAVPIGKSVMLLAKGNKVIKLMKDYLNAKGLEYTEPAVMLEAIGTYVTVE
nr:MAG TPA: hypothetical protein [Bacteriophage sp.]